VLESEGIVNAALGRYLYETRVSVMDDGAFPTNRFRERLSEQIEQRKASYYLGKLTGIPKAGLLFEYIKLNLRDPMIYKGTIKTLIVDQLHNLYAFVQLFLKVYMVDFILTEITSVDRLIIFHDRKQSLMLLTAFAVVPFALLHYLDYIKFTWRVRGISKKTLQGSIIRKFLSYKSEVRGDLSQGTLILAMTRDSTQLVDNGFMASITLFKAVGSIILMFSYQFIAPLVFNKPIHLSVVFAMVIYPVFLCTFILLRSSTNLRSLEDYNDASDELIYHVDNIVLSCQVIHDYDASQPFVQQFEAKVGKYNNQAIATAQLMMNNSYFAPWLALIVVVCYTIKGGIDVVNGDLSLGSFLIDCQIFHEVGVSWGTVYDLVLQLQSSIPRLERVTTLLNFPIDLPQQMSLFKFRRAVTQQMRSEIVERQCTKLPVDLIPIRIVDPTKVALMEAPITMHLCPEVGSPEVSIGQGRLVYLFGPHGEGKSTLLRYLGGAQLQSESEDRLVFVPSHLRILHVSSEPIFFEGSLYDNLCIGIPEGDADRDMARVLRIASRLGMPRHMRDEIESKDVKMWSLKVSQTQRQLLSLARAFIGNPEFLCVHKPIQVLDDFAANKVLELLREFVEDKGIECNPAEFDVRRPRTCFVSSNRKLNQDLADTILTIRGSSGIEVTKDKAKY